MDTVGGIARNPASAMDAGSWKDRCRRFPAEIGHLFFGDAPFKKGAGVDAG